jgi:hypothetical protein
VDATVIDESGFELDGVALLPLEVGHTDNSQMRSQRAT